MSSGFPKTILPPGKVVYSRDMDAAAKQIAVFGLRLRAAREAKGLTLQQLAREAGSGFAAISKIERGDRQPSLDLALRLARALGLELADLSPRDWPLSRDRRVVLAAINRGHG
jgi:transcriptional regulator with XRE-family HTH domain